MIGRDQRASAGLGGEIAKRLAMTSDEHPGLEMMVLVGFVARGEETPESDVDLIIDGPLAENVAARTVLRGRLIEELGRSVQLMSVDDARHAPFASCIARSASRPMPRRSGRWSSS
jgi:predicted nucleotidyltransferase